MDNENIWREKNKWHNVFLALRSDLRSIRKRKPIYTEQRPHAVMADAEHGKKKTMETKRYKKCTNTAFIRCGQRRMKEHTMLGHKQRQKRKRKPRKKKTNTNASLQGMNIPFSPNQLLKVRSEKRKKKRGGTDADINPKIPDRISAERNNKECFERNAKARRKWKQVR